MLQKYLTPLFLVFAATLWLLQFSTVVAAPPKQGQDLAIIITPGNNAVLQGTVEIIGSADHTSFQFYIVEFHPEPVANDQWQIIGDIRETPVIDNVLETWDTSLIPDGSYTLRLRTVRLDGNYSEFFTQQIVISNAQPIPTGTPTTTPTPEFVTPTITPTDVPSTPTIVIDQPIVDTPTPRPIQTSAPLEDPDANTSFIPTVSNFSVISFRDACLYGAGIMVSIFVLFGFFSALRMFIMGFINRRRRKTR